MSVRFEWHGDEFMEQFNTHVLDPAVTEAAAAGADEAAREIKGEGRGFTDLENSKRSPAALSRQPGRRSKPGESPTSQIGKLRESVAHTEAKGGRAAIGSGVKYARWLELGTSTMAPRPWLKRSLTRRRGRKRMNKAFTNTAIEMFKKINLTRGSR